MSNLEQPPFRTVVEDNGLFSRPWQKWLGDFYNNSSSSSKSYTPVATGLTGTAVITGSTNKIGGLLYFQYLIVPSASTSSVLGTTYILLPYTAAAYGSLTAMKVSSRVLLGVGQVDIGTSKAYTPAWSAVTEPISITGFVQIVP